MIQTAGDGSRNQKATVYFCFSQMSIIKKYGAAFRKRMYIYLYNTLTYTLKHTITHAHLGCDTALWLKKEKKQIHVSLKV